MGSTVVNRDLGTVLTSWAAMTSGDAIQFSIVIPAYNRPRRLAECIASIGALEYDRRRFEVIVVDDGSPRDLRQVVEAFAGELPIRYHRQPNAGPASARNAGARLARGRNLVFTDDDCAPAADWLTRYAERFCQAPDVLLGGQVINALADDPYAVASQVLTDYAYESSAAGRGCRVGGYWLFMTANIACSAEGFRRLGGFDTSFPLAAGEDYDFCHRWQHGGGRAMFVPEAVILHRHAYTLRSFLRQHFGYGRGQLQFRQRVAARTDVGAASQFLPFQFGLLRHLLKRHWYPDQWPIAGLVELSQFMTAMGAAYELFGNRANHPKPSQLADCAGAGG